MNKHKAVVAATKPAHKDNKVSLEQRVQDLEARLTAAEEAIRWQPAQPPGVEPAPLSQHAA